jgi:hypothetical protein
MITNLSSTAEAKYDLRVLSNRTQSREMDLQAFRKVIQDNPQWEASLFDEHFFIVRVVPMVEAARKNGRIVNSYQVNSAWADQLHLNAASRQERMSELGPIAEQILADLG